MKSAEFPFRARALAVFAEAWLCCVRWGENVRCVDCGSEKTEASGSRAATRIAAERPRLRRKERHRPEAAPAPQAQLYGLGNPFGSPAGSPLADLLAAQAADADKRRPCASFQQPPSLPPKLETASQTRTSHRSIPKLQLTATHPPHAKSLSPLGSAAEANIGYFGWQLGCSTAERAERLQQRASARLFALWTLVLAAKPQASRQERLSPDTVPAGRLLRT